MSLDTPTSIEHPINGLSHMSFHPLHPPWFLRGVTLGGKPKWIVSLGAVQSDIPCSIEEKKHSVRKTLKKRMIYPQCLTIAIGDYVVPMSRVVMSFHHPNRYLSWT